MKEKEGWGVKRCVVIAAIIIFGVFRCSVCYKLIVVMLGMHTLSLGGYYWSLVHGVLSIRVFPVKYFSYMINSCRF